MGEVYRARDTRLGRVVAIKVILEAYASDPERAARFQREAKMLAALNHPRIAALYGLEQADGVHFLVMELIEGETLAERIARGPLKVEEAIGIALQIAEALEAAHERGVIHRDLKPANVKITPDHQVKVLDFGLAKAVESEASAPATANSPTFSMMATQAGVILGTAAYMSPEQAKGFAVDHRSDVFSFGTVLFEMLTGRQPFQGDTAAEVLASVLVREPEVSGLPADTNPRLIELVARCLQKSPKRRWQHIGDVRAELEALAAAPRSMITSPFAPVPQPLWRRAIVPAVCAVAAAALAGFAVWSRTPVAARPVVTFTHVLPEDQNFTNAGRNLLAISPDGGTLVYVANRRLYRRALADLHATLIPGFDGQHPVTSPAISPDGQSVVFFSASDDSLKRIPLAGGSAHTLVAAQNPSGIDWSRWGIVYSQPDGGIMRIADAGGQPEVIVPAKSGEQTHMPQMLSDDIVLYSVARGLDAERWSTAKVVARSLRTGVTTTLIEGGSAARYLASGHLLYAVDHTYFARLFDLDTLEVRGAPVPVLEGVARSTAQSGAAHVAVSATGTLVYVPGTGNSDGRAWTIVTADRTGTLTPLKAPPADYGAPRASPDGRRVAVYANDGPQGELAVFVYDLAGDTAIRRVTLEGNNRHPVWTADSARVTFQSDREGDEAVFWQDANGSSSAERLTRPGPDERHIPESWSPDGQTLLIDVVNDQRHALWALSMRDRKLTRLVDGTRVPTRASFSPDGKWIVYMTERERAPVLQVQPFPATGAKYELPRGTPDGSPPHDPVWGPGGRELFYIQGPGLLSTVPIVTAPAFTFGNATSFPRKFATAGPLIRGQYDVTPDGRFIGTVREPVAVAAASGAERVRPVHQVTVVLNWIERLKALVPAR